LIITRIRVGIKYQHLSLTEPSKKVAFSPCFKSGIFRLLFAFFTEAVVAKEGRLLKIAGRNERGKTNRRGR